VDRQTSRFLELEFDRIREQGTISNPVSRHGRSDGFCGYDAGHVERHYQDEVRRHFQEVAEALKNAAEKRRFDGLVIGCHETNWPDFENQLHADVKRKVVGRFSGEFAAMSDEAAVDQARKISGENLQKQRRELLQSALDGARSNGRGVTGLRRVLRAAEQGEVETIIMSSDYSARAVECTNCGHLDSHLVPYCPVCGRGTRQLDDVCEALVPFAVRNNLGLVLLPADDSLNQVGNIAAVLRFRADQNANNKLAS
jgi:peptide subunit release factor 1 (eRF1)